MPPEFNFFQHWYPISPVEDLDAKRPSAVTILGLHLVIWKPTSSETYRVFLDRCPHRLAPLSEGRVDEKTGHLMCSYHGWQFDEKGICTSIPQAENVQLVAKNQQNLCARALPCCQKNDLLWVWLDVNSVELAATTPLPLSPQVDADKGFVWSSFVRDLEYDWTTLVENVADPSHVPFAHHGVQGNREQATPIQMEIVESTRDLIEVNTLSRFKAKITFEPPCRLEYAISFGDGGKQVGLVTYCIPIAPGKSRIVAQFPRNFAKALHKFTPRWWDHVNTRNQVLDGDMIFLHQQEYFLKQQENWSTAYRLPTTADRLVIEVRRWFDKYCQGRLPWSEVNFEEREKREISDSRQELLNRYRQHTQLCHSCRNANKTLQRLQWVLLGNFVLTISGVALMPNELRLNLGLFLMGEALLGLAAYIWLRFWLMPKFYFVDYVHSDR